MPHTASETHPAVLDVLKMQQVAADKGRLNFWTIYDKPTDYPHGFCARRHEVPGGPTEHLLISDLDDLRWIFEGAGLHCLKRGDGDDVKIVETWV